MKKLCKQSMVFTMIMVLMFIMLTGCGKKEETVVATTAESTSEETTTAGEQTVFTGDSLADGVLTVGMEIGYPPFEYFDTDGVTPTGVDVELSAAIAEELGVEVKLIDTAWDGIFAGLAKGDYDCIMSAVTITPDRLLEFDFSTPYIQNYQCIVSRKDGAIKPASMDELAGLKVGYQEETTSDFYVADYMTAKGIQIETYEYAKVIQVFDELELGRIDAIVCDSTVALSYVGEGSIYEITWQQPDNPEEFGVCIQKGNTELVEKVNAALKALKESGKLDEILSKYF